MKLNELTVNVRPLPPYQALDLGFAMAKAWFFELWSLWVKALFGSLLWLIIPVMAFCVVAKSSSYAIVLVLAGFVWFAKPILEYNVLLFLSQKLFDKTLTADNFNPIKALTFRQSFGLLWLKFSPKRPLKMAVTYLENQTGNDRKNRLKVLTRGSNNALSLQIFVLLFVELILVTGSWLFLIELFSFDVLGYQKSNWIFEAEALPTWFLLLCFVVYVLIESVLGVFFVASSFGLYVCRRSLLEGWDIELGFRELASRFADSQKLNKKNTTNNRGEQ